MQFLTCFLREGEELAALFEATLERLSEVRTLVFLIVGSLAAEAKKKKFRNELIFYKVVIFWFVFHLGKMNTSNRLRFFCIIKN